MKAKKTNKKNARVTLLFTADEIQAIQKKAAAARVAVSLLCRQAVLKSIGCIQLDLFK